MKLILISALLCAMLVGPAVAQAEGPGAQSTSTESSHNPQLAVEATTPESRFDLDFKGGSIRALFDAISAARGKSVNVYIPQEAESVMIQPFKMSRVGTKELLEAISGSTVAGSFGGAHPIFRYWFASIPKNNDAELWAVKIDDRYTEMPSNCSVYSLSPYLEAGLSVDDITTAIRTAWKMLSYTPPTVNLSYHRETKLLIAVAPDPELHAIEQVLGALPKGASGKKSAAPVTVEPVKVNGPKS